MQRRPSRPAQRGATLIEVLVSIVIVAIGLLGAAALQASATRNSQSSYERSQMTVLGNAMLDAMRNNLAGVDAAQYQQTSWTCSASGTATLAAADITRWIGELQTQINASACGRISCTARVCTVGIRWDDARATGGDSAYEYVLVSRL